jgi:hypothetical protein
MFYFNSNGLKTIYINCSVMAGNGLALQGIFVGLRSGKVAEVDYLKGCPELAIPEPDGRLC